jgi:hypothetical protein
LRTEADPATAVARVLADYAARGLLAGLACDAGAGARCRWRFRWFRGREFTLSLDARAGRLRLDGALDNVPQRSRLDRELRAWLRSRQAAALPAHRRTDPACVALALRNAGGEIALLMHSRDHDWTYAARRMIHLLNELYLDFLATRVPLDWLVDTFGLDPDDPAWP